VCLWLVGVARAERAPPSCWSVTQVVRNIVLRNITENELAEVSLAPFDHTQVFSVINSRAPVPPNGGRLTLMVQFAPSGEGRFERRMTLRTSLGPLVVRLSGEGVAPKMVLENNITALDMKDAFMNEMVRAGSHSRTIAVAERTYDTNSHAAQTHAA